VGPVCGYDLLGDIFGFARQAGESVRRWVPATGATQIASLEVDDGSHTGSVHAAVSDETVDQHGCLTTL